MQITNYPTIIFDPDHPVEREMRLSALHYFGSEGAWLQTFMREMLADPTQDCVIIFVAKIGGRGDDFAVYRGDPPQVLLNQQEYGQHRSMLYPTVILAHGDKVVEELARALFPEFTDYEYRG